MTFKGWMAFAFALATPVAVGAQAPPIALTWESAFKNNMGARGAALSPDGRFAAVSANTTDKSGIFLVPVAGGTPQFWVSGTGAEWLPDGKGIVFVEDNDVWTVAVGSTTPRRITNDKNDERALQASPDGRTIAFYSGRSGNQDIWLVPTDGSAPARQVTKKSMALDDFRYAP